MGLLRRFATSASAAAVLVLALSGAANALTITFDENGNGILDGLPITGVLAADPSNPGHDALIYNLGDVAVGVGDVSVIEFGSNLEVPVISDWIRFTNANGDITGTSGNLLIFYSDCSDGCDTDLADTGFPTNIGTGATGGPVFENADGTFQFVASGPNTYNGISDGDLSVPEPLTLSMFGIGLGVAAALRRRRSKAV